MTTEQQVEAVREWYETRGYIPCWTTEKVKIGDMALKPRPGRHPLDREISRMGRYRIVGTMSHSEVLDWFAAIGEPYSYPVPFYKLEVLPD